MKLEDISKRWSRDVSGGRARPTCSHIFRESVRLKLVGMKERLKDWPGREDEGVSTDLRVTDVIDWSIIDCSVLCPSEKLMCNT